MITQRQAIAALGWLPPTSVGWQSCDHRAARPNNAYYVSFGGIKAPTRSRRHYIRWALRWSVWIVTKAND